MTMDSKRTLLFLTIMVIANLNVNAETICKLTPEKPEPTEYSPLASEKMNALVDFSGHLVYKDKSGNEKLYMPLKLASVSLVGYKYGKAKIELDLTCAKFGLNYESSNNLTYVSQISVDLELPTFEEKKGCGMFGGRVMGRDIIDEPYHHKCPFAKLYPCTEEMYSGQVLDVGVDRFEFELFGNVDLMKEQKFTHQAQICSEPRIRSYGIV